MCFNCMEMLFNVVFQFPFAILGDRSAQKQRRLGCSKRNLGSLDNNETLPGRNLGLSLLLPHGPVLHPASPLIPAAQPVPGCQRDREQLPGQHQGTVTTRINGSQTKWAASQVVELRASKISGPQMSLIPVCEGAPEQREKEPKS